MRRLTPSLLPMAFVLIATAPALLGVATSTTAGATSSTSGIATKSATQIVAAVERAEASARSLHVHGTIHQKTDTVTFDLDVQHSGDGTGTFNEQSQTIKVIKIGSDLYLHANKAFWEKNGNPQLTKEVGDRWVKTSTTDASFGSLAQFFGVARLTTQLFPSGTGPITKGTPVKVDGDQTVPLIATVTANGATAETTLYVAATGTPFVVEAVAKNDSETGTITYTRYGEKVSVKAPSKPIDLPSSTVSTTTTAPPTTTTG